VPRRGGGGAPILRRERRHDLQRPAGRLNAQETRRREDG
jgi:hypothetical protein